MSRIRVVCPHCNAGLKVAPEILGQSAQCPRCGKQFSVPLEPTQTRESPAKNVAPNFKNRSGIRLIAGELPGHHKIVGIVYGYASSADGCSNTAGEETFEEALNRLSDSGIALGADAITHVQLQSTLIPRSVGCGSATSALEVFAWGTAVEFE